MDDGSTDNTAGIVKRYDNIKLISLREQGINSYKKKALETGIASASGEWIVTTDADCIPGKDWLQTMAAFINIKQPVFVAAPVSIHCNSSVLQVFQAMDFMVLQGITGAVVHKKQMSLCSGANLAYKKSVFDEVGGFSGIDHIASGDDMLLMYKIWKQYPDRVCYLKNKDAIVGTAPMKTWKTFLNQRFRWASKAKAYDDKRILPVILLVYCINICFLLLIIAGFRNADNWLYAGLLWIGKTLVELPLFISLASFFKKQWMIKLFFPFQPLHIFYTIIAGFFSQFGRYEWKGRKVK